MIAKVPVRILQVLSFLVLAMIVVTPSFAEPMTSDSSSMFNLASLTPISFAAYVASTSPTATFNVALAGYFLVNPGTTLTGGGSGAAGNNSVASRFSGTGPTFSGTGTSTGTSTPVGGTGLNGSGNTSDLAPQSLQVTSLSTTLDPTPVPEPSTVWLVGLGLFLVIIRSRFRNHGVVPR